MHDLFFSLISLLVWLLCFEFSQSVLNHLSYLSYTGTKPNLGRTSLPYIIAILLNINNKHLSIQTKVRIYQTLVLSILLYASETWTSLGSDMKAIESFHMKCQRRILGIKWHNFVRNPEVSLRTGLTLA